MGWRTDPATVADLPQQTGLPLTGPDARLRDFGVPKRGIRAAARGGGREVRGIAPWNCQDANGAMSFCRPGR